MDSHTAEVVIWVLLALSLWCLVIAFFAAIAYLVDTFNRRWPPASTALAEGPLLPMPTDCASVDAARQQVLAMLDRAQEERAAAQATLSMHAAALGVFSGALVMSALLLVVGFLMSGPLGVGLMVAAVVLGAAFAGACAAAGLLIKRWSDRIRDLDGWINELLARLTALNQMALECAGVERPPNPPGIVGNLVGVSGGGG